MKIAFINAPFVSKGLNSFLFNLSSAFPSDVMCSSTLSYLATMVKDDYEVRVFDANLDEKEVNKVDKFNPDVVVFITSVMMPSPAVLWVHRKAKELKKRFDCTIVYGGRILELLSKEALTSSYADYVLRGEAEFSFKLLIDFLSGKRKKLPTEGLGLKKGRKIVLEKPAIIKDLDKLPIPDRSFFNLKKYSVVGVETSRGCIHNCDFCYQSYLKAPWRFRSFESLRKEIDYLFSNFEMGRKRLFLVDNNFLLFPQRMRKFGKYLIERGYKIKWFGMTEISACEEETLKILQRSGCIDILIGVESGSPSIQKKYRKIFSRNIVSIVSRVNKCKINPTVSLLICSPKESKVDLYYTLKLASQIEKECKVRTSLGTRVRFEPHLFEPLPGTAFYNQIVKEGLFKPPSTFEEFGKFLNDLSRFKTNAISQILRMTRDIDMNDLKKLLFYFSYLNSKSYILPRTESILFGG